MDSKIQLKLILASATFGLLFSCTSPSNEKSFQITLPEASEFRVNTIMKGTALKPATRIETANAEAFEHVVLNVNQGGKISKVVHCDVENLLEGRKQPNCRIEKSGQVTIEAGELTGDKIQVQALAILSGDGGGLGFVYGDNTALLNTNNVSVEVELRDVLENVDVESMRMANVSGRYVAKDGSFPTGRVDTLYDPGAGRTEMLIQSSTMLSGWIRMFVIENINFNYRITNTSGKSFYLTSDGRSVDYNSRDLQPSDALMRVNQPSEMYSIYRDHNGDIDMDNVYERGNDGGDEEVRLGFFGPGAAGKKICYPASTQNLGATTNDTYGLYADNQGSQSVTWNPNGTDTASTMFPTGGVAETACASGREFVDFLKFDIDLYINQGEDKVFGVAPPFKLLTTDHGDGRTELNAYNTSVSGNNLSVQWELIDGASNLIEGIDIFVLDSMNRDTVDELHRAEGLESGCDILFNENPRYPTLARKIGIAPTAGQATLELSSIPNVDNHDEYPRVTLCPFIRVSREDGQSPQKTYLTDFDTEPLNIPCSTCGDNGNHFGPPAEQTRVTMRFDNIDINQCWPLEIELQDSNGNRTHPEESGAYELTVSSGDATKLLFYKEPSCTDLATATDMTYDSNNTHPKVYFKATQLGNYTITSKITDKTVTNSKNVQVIAGNNTIDSNFKLELEAHFDHHRMESNECSELAIYIIDENGVPTTITDDTTFEFIIASRASISMYSDDACENQLPNGTYGPSYGYTASGATYNGNRVYMKSSSSDAGVFYIVAKDAGGPMQQGFVDFNHYVFHEPGIRAQQYFSGNNEFSHPQSIQTSDNCINYRLVDTDDNFDLITESSESFEINVRYLDMQSLPTYVDMSIHPGQDCGGGLVSTPLDASFTNGVYEFSVAVDTLTHDLFLEIGVGPPSGDPGHGDLKNISIQHFNHNP